MLGLLRVALGAAQPERRAAERGLGSTGATAGATLRCSSRPRAEHQRPVRAGAAARPSPAGHWHGPAHRSARRPARAAVHQRTGNGHALLLAAGQLARACEIRWPVHARRRGRGHCSARTEVPTKGGSYRNPSPCVSFLLFENGRRAFTAASFVVHAARALPFTSNCHAAQAQARHGNANGQYAARSYAGRTQRARCASKCAPAQLS